MELCCVDPVQSRNQFLCQFDPSTGASTANKLKLGNTTQPAWKLSMKLLVSCWPLPTSFARTDCGLRMHRVSQTGDSETSLALDETAKLRNHALLTRTN